jgi:small basic protein (TIGR04137 family)
MGMHPSLKRAGKSGKYRTVLKRTERIKWLMEKGRWTLDSKVTGLPKIKIVKLKAAKREKPKEAKSEEGEKKPA